MTDDAAEPGARAPAGAEAGADAHADATGGTYVVVDTNALLLPVTDGTDIEAEATRLVGAVRFVVPSSVVLELRGLQQGAGAAAQAARAAESFLGRCRIEATGLPGDDGLLEVARRLRAAVLTNDRNVQTQARRAGLVVLRSRGHGRLMRDE